MDFWGNISEITMAVAAVVALIVAYFSLKNELKKRQEEKNKRLQEEKKQTEIAQQTFFTEYTKRYQEIFLNLPEKDRQVESLEPKEKAYIRAYIDLCSEELYLYKVKKCIDATTWGEWEGGIISVFTGDNVISNYWKKNIEAFHDYADFKAYINNVQNNNNSI
jgi:hypothetical protein